MIQRLKKQIKMIKKLTKESSKVYQNSKLNWI